MLYYALKMVFFFFLNNKFLTLKSGQREIINKIHNNKNNWVLPFHRSSSTKIIISWMQWKLVKPLHPCDNHLFWIDRCSIQTGWLWVHTFNLLVSVGMKMTPVYSLFGLDRYLYNNSPFHYIHTFFYSWTKIIKLWMKKRKRKQKLKLKLNIWRCYFVKTSKPHGQYPTTSKKDIECC